MSEIVEASDVRNTEPSVKDVLKFIGRKGMSDILYCLEKEPKRFSQIMFETKLNPSILDRHLKVLLKFGLVVKDGNFYRLTESGIRVVETIDELLEVFRKNLD
ncbi:helix-turn-helix domain-containing protein [Archaeoglobus neptunius]|uniref:helix-turn-helix domain-containing protein n=1 Tax=Archaeoglobus neptunius TaxID=2798580 RepID=UPI002EDB9EFC